MEIERKFLVKGEFKDVAFSSSRIVQGYLSSLPERNVRVRLRDVRAWLTVKGKSNAAGMSRFEWEKEISPEEARGLLEICEPGIIDKRRYLVEVGGHTWEVDEFYGENEGLVVAEIELSAEEEKFERPVWLGEEVTADVRYYNSQLVKKPFKTWKQVD